MSGPTINQIEILRAKRLRRWLLRILYDARATKGGGRLSGATLHDLVGFAVPPSEAPHDQLHTLQLLRDLVNAGFAVEQDTRRRKDDRLSLTMLEFAITTDGTALVEEQRDPSPLVEDERRS